MAEGGKASAGKWSFGDAIGLRLASRYEYVEAGQLAATSQRHLRYLGARRV